MSTFIPHTEMTADELLTCSRQAKALVLLFCAASGGVQSGRVPYDDVVGPIEELSPLALDLMERVHEALSAYAQDRPEPGIPIRMTGGERNG